MVETFNIGLVFTPSSSTRFLSIHYSSSGLATKKYLG